MQLETHTRFFKLYEIELRSARGSGPSLEMLKEKLSEIDVIKIVKKTIGKADAELTFTSHETVKLTRCAPIPDSKCYALLFRKRDEKVAQQVYDDRKTSALRKAGKKKEEAPSVSSHLFIETTETSRGTNRYRAIVEEVPGLSVSYMQTILQKILSESYTYKDSDGIEKETHTVIRFHGYKSETLASVLNGGSVSFVKLTRLTKPTGLDVNYFTPAEETMVIKLTPAGKSGVLEKLDLLKDWAFGQSWDDFRVNVLSIDKRAKMVEIRRNETAAQAYLVRHQKVTTHNELPMCTDAVIDELCQEALKEFAKKWA